MKVLFLTMSTEIAASSRVRVFQYFSYLDKAQVRHKAISYVCDAQFKKEVSLKKQGILDKVVYKLYSWANLWKCIFLSPAYDVVFIQKVLLHVTTQKLIKLLNKNIVFDFDDAIYLADKAKYGKDTTKRKFESRLIHMLKISKCVIVGNNHIKDYALGFNKDVFVIPSPIDDQRYSPRQKSSPNSKITIGWLGSFPGTVYIKQLCNVFKILSAKYSDLKIELVGSDDLKIEGVYVTTKKWNFDTEIFDLQNFDIGIMPLNDDEWCRGKCGYKILLYMAVGLPVVASPVGVNSEIIKNNITGFLATTEDEWVDKLSQLIDSEKLRTEMGEKGRKVVEEKYSYAVNAPKLLKIFKNIEINGVS